MARTPRCWGSSGCSNSANGAADPWRELDIWPPVRKQQHRRPGDQYRLPTSYRIQIVTRSTDEARNQAEINRISVSLIYLPVRTCLFICLSTDPSGQHGSSSSGVGSCLKLISTNPAATEVNEALDHLAATDVVNMCWAATHKFLVSSFRCIRSLLRRRRSRRRCPN